MEKIKSHPIRDVWRVKAGVLVTVDKYNHLQGYYPSIPKSLLKGVKGCTGLKELKADLPLSEGLVLKKGTFMLNGTSPVEPLENFEDFRFDVTSSGGSIYGSVREVKRVLEKIQDILDSYKGE